MEREYVESSMMTSIGYDADSSTLEIEFKNGVVWQYYDYPESEWHEFQSADSQGKFFHREIKDRYSGQKVE